ncbi:MAG: M20/M25/M40 family metallo-hydrolase [Balneolaceae bacterium]
MKKYAVLLLIYSLSIIPVLAQSAQEIYLNAFDDWHDGRYPDALSAFQEILDGPESEDYFERIALQTGELFEVIELSADGSNLRFSDDDKFAIYERTIDEKLFTNVYDLEKNQPFLEVHGKGLKIVSDGSVIFQQVEDNDDLKRAAKKRDEGVARARASGDRSLWRESLNEYALAEAKNTRLFYMNRSGSSKQDITPDKLIMGEMLVSSNEDKIYFVGLEPGSDFSDIYEFSISSGQLKELTDSGNFESDLYFAEGGEKLVFNYSVRNSISSAANAQPEITTKAGVLHLAASTITTLNGRLVDVQDNLALALQSEENKNQLMLTDLSDGNKSREIFSTEEFFADPVLSPEGTKVAFSMKDQNDYEIYVVDVDSEKLQRVSREIQHDRFPIFLSENKLIAAKGEGRHRRSFMYDLESGEVTRLFHNNTLRTIAPEYEWSSNKAGDKLMIVAERDGNTISPERGVYLLDLTQRISKTDLAQRLDNNLEEELALREKGKKLYERISEEVAEVVSKASRNRVYNYEEDLYKFDSKYISQPGNDKAAEYLFDTYSSFGYEPEYQWFTPPGREVYDGKTANVIATLKGTTNPELVYVVSSHYDSVEGGPGADDNTSGTAALLEAARILADNPMPATIIFASFTGEEAGLLGSREFVRLAQENGMNIVGALNNDMVGMANDSRLDNTIRYSNPGIRDIQHASAFLFTDMVTYDALYYKFTDAHAYYEAYGDIVGGIGSYPVLGNPFYHQWNDNLETINHQLVTEVAKSTAATLMLLTSSPSRIQNVTASAGGEHSFFVDWEPSPESGIREYLVRYETAEGEMKTLTTDKPGISISDAKSKKTIQIKAVNESGMEGWDWARAEN